MRAIEASFHGDISSLLKVAGQSAIGRVYVDFITLVVARIDQYHQPAIQIEIETRPEKPKVARPG
jgi:hypothetical protein